MGFSVNYSPYLAFIMLLLPALSLCYPEDTFVTSRATYYGSHDWLGTPTGACGFGDYGRTVNDGKVAGVSWLWRNGIGCGACYQVKCTKGELCSNEGTYVVVTDYGEGDHTDFILSPAAYAAMAYDNNAAHKLYYYGVVEVQFRRVACPNPNLVYQVHEKSNFPYYLAIVILNAGDKNDVVAVEAWQADCNQWRPMRRAYGAVFDLDNPPRGAITLRFFLTVSTGHASVEATNVIPADWKVGAAYESQIVLN